MNRLARHVASTSSLSIQPCRYTRRMTGTPHWVPQKYDHRFTRRDNENTLIQTPSIVTPENVDFVRQVDMTATYAHDSPLVHAAQEQNDAAWTPTSKRTGMLVRKIGIMPQWTKDGRRWMCTVLQVLDNHVISYVDAETWYTRSFVGKRKAFNKYGAFGKLTVGAIDADPNKFTAEYNGQFARAGVNPKQKLGSFMVSHDARMPPGTRLSAEHFRYVTLTGKTVDWGFEGGMHRWGMRGQSGAKHSTKSHRRIGSIGTSGMAMVLPGKKMPGHMGWEWRHHVGVQCIWVKSQAVPGETNQVLQMTDTLMPSKRIQNPPFPTFIPSEPIGQSGENGEPIEYFHPKLFQFTDPSIEFVAGGDDAYQLAMRRAAVKKQAKAKRK